MTHNPESLDCESFEDRIHQILDDRLTLTGDWLLMDHAAQCEPCTEKLLDYDSVDDSMKMLKPDIDRILAEAEKQRPKTFADNPLALLASLAALFLICVTAFYGLNSDSGIQSANRPNHPEVRAKITSAAKKKAVPAYSGSTLAVTSQVKPKLTRVKHRATPDTSPFSPNFNVRKQIQLPRIPNANEVTKRLEPLEPVFNYSAEIPGLRTLQCSLNITIELLRQSFSKPQVGEKTPDLGFWIESDLLAAV